MTADESELSSTADSAVAEQSHQLRSREIGGFRTYAVANGDELLSHLRGPAILVALNAEKLASTDEHIRRIVNRHVGYPDGIGAVLALRRRGLRSARVAGSDLWLAVVRRHSAGGRFYLLGSTDAVVSATVARLRQEFPGIDIAGYRHGYLGPDDLARVQAEVVGARPDVVFVAAGSPRQELWMERLFAAWPALYMGLGGSFDIYARHRRRAPRWMRRVGIEWAFRMVVDTRRVQRLQRLSRFAWLLVRGRL
jgi:UDP-N-acetyl-D-mannosaminouronate:lipid I N-acetyl-D-mannosaminouronosyltransferase